MTKLIRIRTINYKPFYGTQLFEFSTDNKKPFNVICADNGAGKTTTLDMISWCFYGKEKHKPEPIDRILNDKKRFELKKDEITEVNVEIALGESEEEIEYILSRSLTFHKDKNGVVRALPHTEKFNVKLKDARNNYIDAADPIVPVNRVFPEEIQHLFMFDGEKLQHLFEGDNSENTRKAIIEITQIDFLTETMRHLNSVAKYYLPEEEEDNPVIEQYEALIKGARTRIGEGEFERNKCDAYYREAKTKLDEILDKLKGLDNKDLKDLLEREKKLNSEKEKLIEEIDDLKSESFKHLLNSVPLIFCKSSLKSASHIIDEKYECGELPPNIKLDFLEHLLNKKKKCICGTPLTQGSSARKLVEEFRDKSPLSKYEESIRHGQSEIKILLSKTSAFQEERRRFFISINDSNRDLIAINESLNQIKKDIGSIPQKEIESLYSQKEFQIEEMSRYNTRKGEINKEIEIYDKDITRYEKQMREEQKKLIKNTELKDKFDICDSAIKFLENVKENLLNEVKIDIESRTNELFKYAIHEPRADRISIQDNFQLQVLNHKGENIYSSLSEGQKESLAISFMLALRQESGFDSPILIDFLFGRISGANRIKLLNNLEKLSSGMQFIFFFIDTEFTPDVKSEMKSKLGSLIEIKKVEKQLMSQVKQIERN